MTKPKRRARDTEPRDMDERVSLHGPEYEEVVKAFLDTPRDQATSDDTDAESDEEPQGR